MGAERRGRAAIKLGFWTAASLAVIGVVLQSHRSGQMTRWYYHTAAIDGYAINTRFFEHATPENPVFLAVRSSPSLDGPVAVPVKKGERLPAGTNGVLSEEELSSGKRAAREEDRIRMMVPLEIKESKGFRYKDTFMHKGVSTNPWSGVWNLVAVISMGITLGFMAEGLTDLLGLNIRKLRRDSTA